MSAIMCGSQWSVTEQTILLKSVESWLSQHTRDKGHLDSFHLYIFVASELEGKSTRDVALRIRWLLQQDADCLPQLAEFFRSHTGRAKADEVLAGEQAIVSLTGNRNVATFDYPTVCDLLTTNDTLLSTASTELYNGDLSSRISLQHIHGSILEILEHVATARQIYRLPRLPIELRTALSDTLLCL